MVVDKLTVVSRKSPLALQQADIVKQLLLHFYPGLQINIIGISTSGDEILDQPLNKIGGKGLFVNELEKYLLENKADIAVHSMKDLPAMLHDGLGIGAVLQRADPRDAFVSKRYSSFKDLPIGSVIGTSSLRRQAQILALRPDLIILPLRGNVETRINKMLAGDYSAIILAAAGLQRLGLTQWLQHPFELDYMLPAVGQGALGIEYKLENTELKQLLAVLNDEDCELCLQAERAMNAILNGGCQAPIAGFAYIEKDVLILQGLVAEPDGSLFYKDIGSGPKHSAINIGKNVGKQLIAKGANDVISKLRLNNAW